MIRSASPRDAAVDPSPDDFPGVVGSVTGADPHGPAVRCIQVGSPEWDAAVAQLRALEAAGLTWADREQA